MMLADLLLAQQAIDQLERDLGMTRQDFRDHHAARRGIHAARDRLAFGIDRLVARLDLGMQRDGAGEQRVLDLADVVERAMPSPGSLGAFLATGNKGQARCPGSAR